MSETHTANPEMAELWNGPGARSWITAQALLDEAFRGFETRLPLRIGCRLRHRRHHARHCRTHRPGRHGAWL